MINYVATSVTDLDVGCASRDERRSNFAICAEMAAIDGDFFASERCRRPDVRVDENKGNQGNFVLARRVI